ncbi:MAG: 2-oxo acid dehydrogenase subunit E2 [Armatimonadetes bacterium]|nr:2-oxo acid dehydrogenase subunit E2 [Armatimonadota bacterium]
MTEVIMPKMGDGMEEGTLLEWLKKDGDTVKSGEVIGTIQTDKATLELESPGSGKLAGILVQAGANVPVGKPMAAILKGDESLPSNWGSGSAAPAAEPEPVAVAAGSNGSAAAAASAAPAVAAPAGRLVASPLAKKVAAGLGVDLATVSGTGPGGRIIEKDVRAAAQSAPAKQATAAPVFVPLAASAADTNVALNRLRQITAKRTQESKQTVPHFYVTVEVDVERIMDLRTMFEEEGSGKVSINDFVVRAVALALREMPVVNSSYQGDHLLQHGNVSVGIAVALEDGLTVPVVHHADRLSLRQISAAVRDLAGRARENKLSLDELSGSTFAVSNMGMLDVDNFGAIINQPNSGIVAIASVRKKVVAMEDDEVQIRQRMNITGSFDHRVVDGAVGAKFMNIVRAYLENPTRLLS